MTVTAELTGAEDPGISRCTTVLTSAVEDVFVALQPMIDAFTSMYSAQANLNGMVTSNDLAPLQGSVFQVLDDQPALDSAGFVVVEGVLADRDRHLDWWHRTPSNVYELLVLNLDPDAPDCYDYYAMEWFAAAVTDHRRFVSGPLIDLPCADVYILTFSAPILVEGRLLGIAGADVAVSRFERVIVPPLRGLAADAVVVNAERRVIASNSATWTTGEKLPESPLDDARRWSTVEPVTADLGWLLAVGHEARRR